MAGAFSENQQMLLPIFVLRRCLMAIFGFIIFLVNLLLNWIVKQIAQILFSLMQAVYKLVLFGPDLFDKVPIANSLFDIFQSVAVSMILLISIYQAFKSIFAYFGFEAEEPYKIFFKTAVFGFLVYQSKDLVIWMLTLYRSLIDVLFEVSSSSADAAFQVDWATVLLSLWTIEAFVLIYMCFKFFFTAYRFAERYALNIILSIVSPLAMACGISTPTRQYFVGWMRVFIGNMLVQIVHILGFTICIGLFNGEINLGDKLFSYVLIIATLNLMDRAEDIVNNLSVVSTGTGAYFSPNFTGTMGAAATDLSRTVQIVSSRFRG